MPFLNSYTQAENYNFVNVIKVSDAVYSIGSLGNQQASDGAILKTDLNGNIIWEYRYGGPGSVTIQFKDLVEFGNGDLLLYSSNENIVHLFRIKPDGAVVWSKSYEFLGLIQSVSLAVSESSGGNNQIFLMNVCDHFWTQEGYYTHGNRLLKLNGDGSLVVGKSLDYAYYNNSINYARNNLVLINNEVILYRWGSFIRLDNNFNLIDKFKFRDSSWVKYVGISGQNLLMGGRDTLANRGAYIAKINYLNHNAEILYLDRDDVLYFSNTGEAIYAATSNKIIRCDHSLNPQWEKNIALSGIHNLNSDGQNVLFSARDYNQPGTIVAVLNSDIDSCKTLGNPVPSLAKEVPVINADFEVKVSPFTIVGNSLPITKDTITSVKNEVCIFKDETEIKLGNTTSLQSPGFYLQAAGSEGQDSSKGIHLRWAFRETLAGHLPKGNYATTSFNFNKSEDFVNVYRAKYVAYAIKLDLNIAPIQINEGSSQKNWLYSVTDKVFHIHFRDTVRYNQVRASINPANTPLVFIAAYGDSLLEIETKSDLSFKVSPIFEITGGGNSVKTELLSVAQNKITAPKAASLRKTYSLAEINQNALVAENIRSVRFRSTNGYIKTIAFEFYDQFITGVNSEGRWDTLGKYALTKEDAVAFERLEPQPDTLKKWLRYNDLAYVNPLNYKTRWNGSNLPPLERIVTSVERYIALSDSYDNPQAIEYFPFEDQSAAAACAVTNDNYDPYIPESPNEANSIPVSYLDVLSLGAADYHNARMLGLGTLDLDEEVFSGEYIYVAEYITFGDLQDGLGAREVQHLYCSLPTSLSDQRLPIAVDLKQPVPGLFFDNGYDDSEVNEEEESEDPEQIDYSVVELTDDGYTPDGKTRYYTFYAESIFDEDYNAPFYYVNTEFAAAESTYPVFAGIEYRKTGDTRWIKPELSYNPEFYNIDSSGIDAARMNETVEIVIPDEGKPMYSHAVKESGKLDYSSYGINWFSRASQSGFTYTVETQLKPANELLPPTSVMATLIQKESPLILSTAAEQSLYEENSGTDKTIVRLTFEYNHAQELIDYHHKINGEVVNNYFETPDHKEPFADEIQVFFRDRLPASISGKVKAVTPSSNPLMVQITTEPYIVISQGINENIIPQTEPPTYNEVYTPSIEPGSENNYKGSIFLVNGVDYIIQEVNNSGTYPTFLVLKADASAAMLNLNSGAGSNQDFVVPEEDALFMVVENMQNSSSWNLPANPGFTVKIDLTDVYREGEIIIENTDCSTETHVQKFRGVYQDATISKFLEKVDLDDNGSFDVSSGVEGDPNNLNFILKHRGVYRVTFPGFHLPQHSQYTDPDNSHANSVEWYNGIARLHTLSDLGTTPRKEFKVIRTENIGTSNDLVLYIQDLTFPLNEILLESYKGKIIPDGAESITQVVNYYPGYKLYLYKDSNLGLNAGTVLPVREEDLRYTIFGLRSKDLKNEFENDNTIDFFSKMSIPALMFANAIREPLPPQMPTGGMYATRPDYFGKASYTFTTKYGSGNDRHKPYSVQFNRASDVQFLSAIYDTTVHDNDLLNNPVPNTLQIVLKSIFMDGEEDFYVDRWNNLLRFDYTYPDSPVENGNFKEFDGRRLPLPNNSNFIASINTFIDEHNRFYNLTGNNAVPHLASNFNLNTLVIPGIETVNGNLFVKDFLRDVLMNCFTPLTEIPIVYNYVNGNDYVPIPKKQVVRDRNGNLLNPSDTNFDMAPMMKRIDPANGQYESQFTDFGLDGASNARYFYAAREMNNQLKTSEYSGILGPISLVNTAPPVAPQIIKVIPVLENRLSDIAPAIQLQINSYPKPQHIAKATIYRTTNPAHALSVRTMEAFKVINLEEEGILENSQWILNDNFDDLSETPFGDPLFYRVTVSRRIRYNDSELNPVVDYTPSEASSLIITNIVENYNPASPILDYYSEPLNQDNELGSVILHWEKTCYKGKYHVYKMNSQGNWVKIHELQTNQDIYLPLAHTDLDSGILTVIDDQGNPIYHHFKVIAENTAGMLSTEEYILTIYIQNNWQDIGGIGEMIVGNTFVIR